MTMLLVMLHTGTMFAVIVYFWRGWRRDYLASSGQTQWFGFCLIATFARGWWDWGSSGLSRKYFCAAMRTRKLKNYLTICPCGGALTAVGVLIIVAGLSAEKTAATRKSNRNMRFGSGWCRGFVCRSAVSRVPAPPFPPGCCWGCRNRNSRSLALPWRWC